MDGSRPRSGSLLSQPSTKYNASSSRPPIHTPPASAIDLEGGGAATAGGDYKRGSESDQSIDMELSSMHSSDDETYPSAHDGDYDSDDEETGLTQTERKKRRRRRRRRLSHSHHAHLTAEEKGIAKTALIRRLLINGLLILLWYSFSISISVYNKWMFSAENLDFHFPLFTTSIHMLVQFSLASLVIIFLPRFRPGRDKNGNIIPANPEGDGQEHETHRYEQVGEQNRPRQQQKPPLMTKSFYLTRITPCGSATALDIGLGNFSLRFISLTFFTMCKSSVLAFVLLFAFIFRLEKPTIKLCLIILLMTVGVILMVSGEAAFNVLGFILVMTASLCSGFRWSLTQILLLRNRATSNPFSSIFFLTPVMFFVLFILAVPIEGPRAVLAGLNDLTEAKGTFVGVLLLLFPGCLAFMMVAAEFALLQRTSVVTLSVCGIFKEVLTISAASATFGDELSPINVSGLIVTIASIAAYNWLKYSGMSKEAKDEAHAIVSAAEADVQSGKRSSIEQADEFAIGRDSMGSEAGGLMRDSLHLAADHDRSRGPQKNDNLRSPTKRPEDLE
ncbi:hypothetical protein CKM354_001132400 [Cercospora kikuchii]|uniref:Sugar phosphate transporter domain-containing protein n=1 Tax=Cercospora kikuchii TaxID=84275 RepID=A0A9P3FI76_9PEZI|nr:uncharacterized protein CKM354_001132400 [Cercospora kikuchii]GIZ48256.1 hypothetical protein CKM354_001132400 [Cercospora kikuchii]